MQMILKYTEVQIKPIKNYLSSLNIDKDLNDLSHIQELIQKHVSEFAFSSIPVLLKEELSLELDDLYKKVIVQKKGGYCFEHNKLMYEALLSSGFDVRALFARVLNNQDIKVPTTHRVTLLEFDEELYLVDVGFGFSSPSMPVKFGETPTKTKQGTTYLIKEYENENFALGIVLENSFYTLYTFNLQTYFDPDFEMGHFYSHKHEKANFVNNLVHSLIFENEIRSLRNSTYQKISATDTKETMITSTEQLKNILESEFNYPIKFQDVQYLYDNFCRV